MNLEKELYKYFTYRSFRPQQREIISSILDGTDTIALLPTGAGKSICFQLPALLLPGITIVITPLIALMQDQVDTLAKRGIYATYISSTLSHDEVHTRMELLKLDKYKLLYISPERLQQKKFKKFCKSLNISLIVIDEAHCISEWGHDFRPSYLQIYSFIAKLPHRPIIAAFTATATTQTLKDIQHSLAIKSAQFFQRSFYRSNLCIRVLETTSPQRQEIMLLLLLQKHIHQSGIIYVSTRKYAEYLTKLVIKYFKNKLAVGCYHGKLPAKERQYIQKLFMSDKLPVVIATSAFGMGVDKANISFVIHAHYPSCIEAYYQEIGRAGRGGEVAYCYLLFNLSNQEIHNTLLKKITSIDDRNNKLRKIMQMEAYAQSKTCRMKIILQYFNEQKSDQCGVCDRCAISTMSSAEKLQLFLSKKQYAEALRQHRLRTQLQRKYKLSHYAEVITDNQLLLLTFLQSRTLKSLTNLPGFGRGWRAQWATHFMETDDKIPVSLN